MTMISNLPLYDHPMWVRAPHRRGEWYASPIDLPEGRSGAMRIRHVILPTDDKVPVVGLRQAFLRQILPVYVRLAAPLRVHELLDDDGIWMTDRPEELNQIAEMLRTVKPHGHVLIGGLGLGIVAKAVSQLPGVMSTTVIERSADVVRLCGGGGRYRVEIAEIGEYLRTMDGRFDYYLLDTWRGTNEATWWEEIVPLRRAIRNRWGRRPVIHCWAEDIMLQQILRSLMTAAPHWWTTGLPVPMPAAVARRFVRDVGLPAWERRYGAALDAYAAGVQAKAAGALPPPAGGVGS